MGMHVMGILCDDIEFRVEPMSNTPSPLLCNTASEGRPQHADAAETANNAQTTCYLNVLSGAPPDAAVYDSATSDVPNSVEHVEGPDKWAVSRVQRLPDRDAPFQFPT